MTENKEISEIIMSKMKEECAEVSIDFEYRKVVCLDDIGRIIRSELRELDNEIQQYRAIGTVEECRENKNFLQFLYDTINPNDMEKYLAMYHATDEKTDGMEAF